MTRFIFLGTDEFAVAVLEHLVAAGWRPSLIITPPDKPRGRRLSLTPPLVKQWAKDNNFSYQQPLSLVDYQLPSCEFALVASYGRIIPKALLGQPQRGIVNLHPSLLPKYRGPSPIQAAILAGDKVTGVSLMLLDEELDHGPILASSRFSLLAFNFAEARQKLAKTGAELLVEVLPKWLAGKITPKEQEHKAATYTKKITKEDGLVRPDEAPQILDRKFRAFTPWPGIYFVGPRAERVKIIEAELINGSFKIKKVIPEGKPEMTWEDYRRGYLN